MRRLLTTFIIFCLFSSFSAFAVEKVYLFSAASMTDPVTKLAKAFEESQNGKVKVMLSFASSGTLAMQINSGAPAHLFISADIKWIKWLDEKNLLEDRTTKTLAGNSIVLVTFKGNNGSMQNIHALPSLLDHTRLAMADYSHAPVGVYAKSALEHFSVWHALNGKTALFPDVRRVMSSVARGQTDYGIVYRTDALSDQRLQIMYTFPTESHKEILYPVTIIKGKKTDASTELLKFLFSKQGTNILKSYGFRAGCF